MKIVIHSVLVILICVVGFLIIRSIRTPIQFNAEQGRRYDATIERLKDIRTAQIAFRSEHRKFTGDFDSLIFFLKTGEFSVVRIIGDVDDSATVAAGLIFRDTVKVSILDSLFGRDYKAESLRFVPFTDGVEFELGAAVLNVGNVNVPVFEAKIDNDILLKGLDPQLLVNFNSDRQKRTGYAGLRVGSLTETTNNAGNWE
jgi:hypothetical protein